MICQKAHIRRKQAKHTQDTVHRKRSLMITKRGVSTTTEQNDSSNPAQPPQQQYYVSSLSTLKPTVQSNNIPPNIDPGAPRVSTAPPRNIIFNLMGWVHKHGGKVHPAVFYGTKNILRDKSSTDTGNWRGLALQDLPAGEIIAEVPIELCIFPLEQSSLANEKQRSVEFRNALSAIMGTIAHDDWQLRLGLRVLAERAQDESFYTPYIEALPAQYPTFPLFYDQITSKVLEYRPIHLELHKKIQSFQKLSKLLQIAENVTADKLTPLQKCGLDAFNNTEVQIGDLAWGFSSTSSRAFASPLPVSNNAIGPDANDYSVEGVIAHQGYNKCLIPLIDMLNHSFMPNCEVTFKREGTGQYDPNNLEHRKNARVVLRTKHAIQRGQELTISYTPPDTNHVPPTIPVITPENEQEMAKKILETNDIRTLFQLSLARVPCATADGLISTHNNDKLLQHYGFIPNFNIADNISFNPDRSLFETALGLGIDITLAHSYLAGDVAKRQQEESRKKQLENGAVNVGSTPTMGMDNTYETALVKLVIPSPATFIDDQSFLLHSLFNDSNVQLNLDWSGPNDALLGVCRVIAAGAHLPDVKRIHRSSPDNTSVENEIVSQQWSEDQVNGSLQYEAQKLFNLAEKRGYAIAASNGEELPADESELSGPQLFRGFTSGPLSPENELGAMVVLYHTLVLASGGFTTGINSNVEGYYHALVQQQPGLATSHLYARSKKMLTTHALKTLSTRLGLDKQENNFHQWHNRLETI